MVWTCLWCLPFRPPKWFSTTSTQKSFMSSSKSLSIYCTSGELLIVIIIIISSVVIYVDTIMNKLITVFTVNLFDHNSLFGKKYFLSLKFYNNPHTEHILLLAENSSSASSHQNLSPLLSQSGTFWWTLATEEWSSSSPSSAHLTSGRLSPRFSSNSLRYHFQSKSMFYERKRVTAVIPVN